MVIRNNYHIFNHTKDSNSFPPSLKTTINNTKHINTPTMNLLAAPPAKTLLDFGAKNFNN